MDDRNLADPPRNVPLMVMIRLMFGGSMNQFGWVFFGIGVILLWVLMPHVDATGWYEFRGELETAPGRIVACEETSTRINEALVYAYRYEFADPAGQVRSGVSYQSARPMDPGAAVTIEHPSGRVDLHRIRGMRTHLVPPWAMVFMVFPAIGIMMLVPGFMAGRRGCHLLSDGIIASGRLIDKKPTGVRINNRPVYKLTFEFTDQDGQVWQAVAKSHTPEHLEDQGGEPLLYDPLRPARAVLLDALPGRPRIDEAGNIRAGSVIVAVASLLVPAATMAGFAVKLASPLLR